MNLTGSHPPKLILPELNKVQLTTNMSTQSTELHQQKLYSHTTRILEVIRAPRVSEADERQWIMHLAEEVVGLTHSFFFAESFFPDFGETMVSGVSTYPVYCGQDGDEISNVAKGTNHLQPNL